MRFSRGPGVAAPIVAALLIAGCVPSAPSQTNGASSPPIEYRAPAVVGETVSESPLESDEWVIAARAAQLGYVLAANSADFSIEPFVSTFTTRGAYLAYSTFLYRAVGGDRVPFTWSGPTILIPIAVEPVDESTAKVWFCDGSDFLATGDTNDLLNGVEIIITLERVNGEIRESSSARSLDGCDATGAPIAMFDPAPTPLGSITKADVVPPPSSD